MEHFNMASATSLILWIVVILDNTGQAEGITCSSRQIQCRSGNQCVNLRDVCNNGVQCSDRSDEDPQICTFWKYDLQCSRGDFYCSYSCAKIEDYCSSGSCTNRKDARICELVNKKILKLTEEVKEDKGLVLTQELVSLMQQAVNESANYTASCPMFYTRIGEACLAFFSPAKLPWPEARQFCLSIGGDLASIKGVVSHEKLLEYMRMAQLTTDYWTGGRFDVDTNAWSWVYDDTPLPLGSPFWATRYSSSCVPRSPPHTDPYSPAPSALPRAPCYHYLQAPAQRASGWCTAVTYEHYYYFTDEECQETRSPLCLFTGRSHKKAEGKIDD